MIAKIFFILKYINLTAIKTYWGKFMFKKGGGQGEKEVVLYMLRKICEDVKI